MKCQCASKCLQRCWKYLQGCVSSQGTLCQPQKCQTSWKKGQIIHSLLECYCSMIYYCWNTGFIKCHYNFIVMLCYNWWVVGVTWNLKGQSHHLGTSVILFSSSMTLIFEFVKMEWTANICRPTKTEKPFPDDANSHNNKQWANFRSQWKSHRASWLNKTV